ncbi:hypothetical protein OSTOST_10024 [Ostertagia ostertagi]
MWESQGPSRCTFTGTQVQRERCCSGLGYNHGFTVHEGLSYSKSKETRALDSPPTATKNGGQWWSNSPFLPRPAETASEERQTEPKAMPEILMQKVQRAQLSN